MPSPRSAALLLFLLLACAPSGAGRALAHGSLDHELEALTNRVGPAPTEVRDVLRRGELHRLMGNWQAARDDYDRAAHIDPGLIEVDVCRAALMLDTHDAKAAEAVLDRALVRSPDHRRALELRARVRADLGRPLEAAADLDRVIAIGADVTPDLYRERARLLASAGPSHVARALTGLDEARARLGPIPSLELLAVDLEVGHGGYDAALARLEHLAGAIATRDLLERRGDVLAAAGRSIDARASFAAALAEIEASPKTRRGSRAVVEQENRLRARIAAAGTR
jgi:hypothetical protein